MGTLLKRLIYILCVQERYIEDTLYEAYGSMTLHDILLEDIKERAFELLPRTGNVAGRSGFFFAKQALAYRIGLLVEVAGGLMDFISRLQIDLRFSVLYGVFVDFVIYREWRNNKPFGSCLDLIDSPPYVGNPA